MRILPDSVRIGANGGIMIGGAIDRFANWQCQRGKKYPDNSGGRICARGGDYADTAPTRPRPNSSRSTE